MIAALIPLLIAAAPVPAPDTAAQAITAPVIAGHIRTLASDEYEGRGPGTRGDLLARQYIVEQFKALGLKPAAPGGGWFQLVELVGVDGHPDKLVLRRHEQALELAFRQDFIASAGDQAKHTRIESAELVFVGYGIVAPEYKWDDYKGVDLTGKVLVMMNNDPEDDPALFAGKTRLWYGRWDYKYEIAAKRGALGAIIIHTQPSAGYPWKVVTNSWSGAQFELPNAGGPRLKLRGWTTEEATRRLFQLAGKDLDALRAAAQKRDFQPVPLGVELSVDFDSKLERLQTANVLGVLPGSDPALAREVVLYTAHHDHLGRKPDAKPGEDAIYNGAVDNASGVAMMLTVAKAYAALPKAPRRSILFAAVAAEEAGLLGSQYLAEHPPVPIGSIAVDINIDGINIWGRTRDVSAIGLGKSDLDKRIEALAQKQGRKVVPDPFPDRGSFYRSDQFSLAKVGVPTVVTRSGVDYVGRPKSWGVEQRQKFEATRYHQPSDEFDPAWDLSGAVDDGWIYFQLGVEVANADEMPRWNPGDEFEAARKKSLEALKPAGASSGSSSAQPVAQ